MFSKLAISILFFCVSVVSLRAEDFVGDVFKEPEKIPMLRGLAAGAGDVNISELRRRLGAQVKDLAGSTLKKPGFGGNRDFVFAVVVHEFFSRVSAEDIALFRKKDRTKTANFLRWLYKNPELILHFNELGPVTGNSGVFFNDWLELWTQRPDSHNGLGKKAAMILAHLNACGFQRNNVPKQAPAAHIIARYDWFMKSANAGVFLRDVKTMTHFDLRYVLGTHFQNSDLEWCQATYQKPGFAWKGADKIAGSYRMTPYRSKNALGVHVSKTKEFYEGKPPSIETYTRYGGEYTAVSRTGAAFAAAAGVPVFLAVQPNHLSYFWKDTTGHWRGANDIYGLNYSRDQKELVPWRGPPSLALLHDEFHKDLAKSRDSLITLWAANSAGIQAPQKLELYKQALQQNPQNYEAFLSLLQLYAANPRGKDEFQRNFTVENYPCLKRHPLVLEELLARMEDGSLIATSPRENRQTPRKPNATGRQQERAYQHKIYTSFATGKEAVPGSAHLAALRFFLRKTPELGNPEGLDKDLNNRIKTSIVKVTSPNAKRIQEQLETAIKGMAKHKAIRDNFLEHYHHLCVQHPNLREQSIVFLKSLSPLGIPREELENWQTRFAQIKEKRDRANTQKTTTRGNKKKT
jgi:hypothetical protein